MLDSYLPLLSFLPTNPAHALVVIIAHFLLLCVRGPFLQSKSAAKPAASPSAPVERGIVYLGHIPWGFFESNMRSFFEQFGEIVNLKLSRSKKAGRSKGYGFIEFEDMETATIVAETMNGYMMFGQTIRAHVLEPRAIHPQLFKGTDKEFRVMPNAAITAEKHNAPKTVSGEKARLHKLKNKENKKRRQLQAMGINYNFPGYAADTNTAPAPEPKAETAAAPKKDSNKKQKKTSSKKAKKPAATAAASNKDSNKKKAKSPASSTKKDAAAAAPAAKAAPAKAASKKAAAAPAAAKAAPAAAPAANGKAAAVATKKTKAPASPAAKAPSAKKQKK